MVFVNASMDLTRQQQQQQQQQQQPQSKMQTRRVGRQHRRQRRASRTCSPDLRETPLLAGCCDRNDDCIVTALSLVGQAGTKLALCALRDDAVVTGCLDEMCRIQPQSQHRLSMRQALDAMQCPKVQQFGTSTMFGSCNTQTDDQASTGKRTRFNLDATVVRDVTPYSEIYGLHPREFVFDKYFHMLPFDFPCMSDEDSDDRDDSGDDEDEDA